MASTIESFAHKLYELGEMRQGNDLYCVMNPRIFSDVPRELEQRNRKGYYKVRGKQRKNLKFFAKQLARVQHSKPIMVIERSPAFDEMVRAMMN